MLDRGLLTWGCTPRGLLTKGCLLPWLILPEASLYLRETGQSIPHSLLTMGSQLTNLRGRMEKWETQNPKQPRQGQCSEHKIPRKHMPES